MPFAQYHWPFEKNQVPSNPPKLFPADFISEAIDQTRGWFYTLLAVSTLLGFGPPYKNVICMGHVLDEKGEKMSKSRGNVVNPWEVIKKYGVDPIRWYFYTINQPGESKSFSEKEIENTIKRFILIFWNSFLFFQTYRERVRGKVKSKNLLDRWIISKLNNLIWQTSQKLDNYDVTGAAREIEKFVVEDLSLWYIRRSRKRFQKPETKKEKFEAIKTLETVLLNLAKVTAPFIPFLSEKIYQSLDHNKESLHLEDWPKVNKKEIDLQLEKEMEKVRELSSLGLMERAKAGIKVRQPLLKLKIKNEKLKIKKELLNLIKEELNVKEIVFDSKIKKEVELDTKITPQLQEEGIIREVIRQIQDMRKKAKFSPQDRIFVRFLGGTDYLNSILDKNKDLIIKEAKIEEFLLGDKPKRVFKIEREFKILNQKFWLAIRRI